MEIWLKVLLLLHTALHIDHWGLKPSSNTCNRYIDTNRLYKNKYLFFSKPKDGT